MKENIKRKIAMLLTLLGVTSIVIGTTFAIYENTINTNKNHIIKTGVVNFTLTESTNGLVLNNLQELTDYEGMAQEEYYEFTIKNTGDTKTDYEISLVDKPNSSYTGTILNEKYIKVGLLKNNSEEIIVNLKEVNRLIDKVTLDVDKSVNYKLRLWLDLKDITDEEKEALVGQKIFLVLKINGIQNVNTIESMDTSGANKPILASNMIPVYYDETNNVWKKADVSNIDKNNPWYSYNSTGEYKGMWANAVTVTSSSRSKYLNASIGTAISMNDITTMWVWIPRFNAVTPSNYNGGTKDNPGAIDVTFVKQNETAIDAFTFGNKELSGFWYAKFETSHTTLISSGTENNLGCTNEVCSNANGIIIKPNVTSLRHNNISNFFFASRSIEQPNNSFGFVSSEVDTHMSKNNEWGAVAYLTQSIYGRCTSSTSCTEIGINNNYNNDNDNYITGYGAPAGSNTYVTNGAYNTTLGKDASTTGNIYGIYDMSGGAWEYVMGAYINTNGIPGSSSGFSGLPDTKYYNNYTGSSYTGHALTETKNWYSDHADFVNSSGPWFVRGDTDYSSTNAGVFSFSFIDGSSHSIRSSRLVISNE